MSFFHPARSIPLWRKVAVFAPPLAILSNSHEFTKKSRKRLGSRTTSARCSRLKHFSIFFYHKYSRTLHHAGVAPLPSRFLVFLVNPRVLDNNRMHARRPFFASLRVPLFPLLLPLAMVTPDGA